MKVPGFFVTGTNTEVGKTYVGSLIAKTLFEQGINVGVYKPVASGCASHNGELIPQDALELWQAAGKPKTLAEVCPQKFKAPLAPHVAARNEGKRVDCKLLRDGIRPWLDDCDFLIVEGAGGMMSPVSDEDYAADLAFEFGLPLIVVVANELGCINQTLQTLLTAAAYRGGMPVAGIILNDTKGGDVFNDQSVLSNANEISRLAAPPLLESVSFGAENFMLPIDWIDLSLKAIEGFVE